MVKQRGNSNMAFCGILLLAFAILPASFAIQYRQATIMTNSVPNGCSIPHPCDTLRAWCGIGYEDGANGAGKILDPFAVDLAANKYTWNKALCNKDSDGDGMTNGEELGDPNCVWKAKIKGGSCRCKQNRPGVRRKRPCRCIKPILKPCRCRKPKQGLRNPGICEPINSPRCVYQNRLFNCKPDFHCPGIDSPDVIKWDLTMPRLTIPTTASSYLCYFFPYPSDVKYHIIASVGLLQNYEMIDYITLYACWDVPYPAPPAETSYQCTLNPPISCIQAIGNYQYSQSFDCTPKEFGFPIGAENGFKYGILQVHYSNFASKPGIVDESGLRLYYTSKLRPNDGGLFNVGPFRLDIPPGQPWVVQTGNCTPTCGMPAQPIKLTRILPRMNFLGRAFNASIYRNGELFKYLALNEPFSYNSVDFLNLEPYVEMLPGDTIRVDCAYDSTSRECTTHYGEALTDEFCYVLPWYYPQQIGGDVCLTYGEEDHVCNTFFVVPGCNSESLAAVLQTLPTLAQTCNILGGCAESCVNDVVQQIDDIGCLVPDVRDLTIIYIRAQWQTLADPIVQVIELFWACRGMPVVPPGCT